MTSHLINNMRALARAHRETFDFLLENQAVLVTVGFSPQSDLDRITFK